MTELSGRTVLITGASRGLGAALALAFARAGANLALCARSHAALQQVAAAVRAERAGCHLAAVDVRREGEVERWVREAEEAFGSLDVLINNASVLGPRAPLGEHDPAAWREVIEVNLTGAFLVTRAVLPRMLRQRDGSIINVSSGAAVPPRVDWGAYAVSKLALDGFTQNLAAELKATGVRVNSVDPGAMRTAMRTAAYPTENPESVKPPDEAVAVFLWLAGEAAREVSGRRFRADEWRSG